MACGKGTVSMLRTRAFCLILLLSVLLCGCGQAEQTGDLMTEGLLVPEKTNYKTVVVEQGSFTLVLEGNAFAEYPVSENLYWKTADSYLQKCHVSLGEKVKKGDILATFTVKTDPISLQEQQLRLKREQAAFEAEKQAQLEDIRLAEEKAQYLTGVEQELALLRAEKKQTAYESYVYTTEQSLAELRQKVYEMENAEKNNTLTAPFDGIVSSVTYYAEGAAVNTGKAFITLTSTDQILVKISTGTQKLYCGMDIPITDSEQNIYLGTVVSVPHILPDSASENHAVVALRGDISRLKKNTTLTYKTSHTLAENVIVIPRQAMHRENGKSYVYILEDGMQKKRYITEGLSSTDSVWVLDGLEPGQTLILN